MELAYDGYLQKMGLFGQNWQVDRPIKFGQTNSCLVWSDKTHSQVSRGRWIESVLPLNGQRMLPHGLKGPQMVYLRHPSAPTSSYTRKKAKGSLPT